MKIRFQSVKTLSGRVLRYAAQNNRLTKSWFQSRQHLLRDNPVLYVNYALLAVVLYLSVLIALTVTADPVDVSAAAVTAEEQAEVVADQPSLKPLNQYLQQFRKRQIFQPTGRSGLPATVTPTRLAETSEQLAAKITVMGVFFDDDPVVLLRIKGSEESRRYRVGEEVLNFKISRIEKKSVFFTDGQSEFELKL